MKRFVAIFLAAMMMVSCFAMTSFAANDYKSISSLHFTIDTSTIDAGTEPDEIDKHSVKVECTDVHWNPSTMSGIAEEGTTGSSQYPYPNLEVSLTDLECTNTGRALKVGDTVKLKFWVEIRGQDADHRDYIISSSTKAHVSKADNSTGPAPKTTAKSKSGTYEMAITVTTGPIKGAYDAPENVEWTNSMSLGNARWTKPESGNCANVFDFRLRRDGKLVAEFSYLSETSLNVFPWMEKEGDYTFEVRSAVGSGTSGAKRSDWTESDSQYVDAQHVSDGTGKYDPSGSGAGSGSGTGTSGNTTQVGWVKSGNVWYYRYPDGTYRKNGWEKVSGKWYYFDASGAMKTGWVTVNGQTYYLDATGGDMKTGWIKTSDGQWYYMNPDPSSSTQGAMLKNQFADINGKTYYFGASGAMTIGWLKIGDKFYYFNPAQNADLGAMVRNQRVDSFYLGADGAWERGK